MHVLFIGAHPDDCDFSCGGTAVKLARAGGRVKFVSVTNGDRGHMAPEYAADRSLLAARRLEEARAAVELLGGEYECLDVHDGEVYVTPELTERMIRVIRGWGPSGRGPDLVIVNRPNDYHRDHRYTAQVVLDTTYLLTVPFMCPDMPHLERMPVFAYWFDRFVEGGAFRPDVVVPIDDVMDVKTEITMAHASQFFEWLPYNAGTLELVPQSGEDRRDYTIRLIRERAQRVVDACRERAAGAMPDGCCYAEAFQISEYGRKPTAEELTTLFGLG
jgi:LmbE family N-acetylglucosaminyl deacetylase